MSRVILLLAIVAVSGCVGTPYLPPTAGPKATLTFVTSGDPTLGYVATLSKVKDINHHGCYDKREDMAKINKGNPFAGHTHNPSDIPIAAGAPIELTAIFAPANLIGQTGCRTSVDFVPEAGKSYELSVRWQKSSCNIQLNELEGGTRTEVKSAKLRHDFC